MKWFSCLIYVSSLWVPWLPPIVQKHTQSGRKALYSKAENFLPFKRDLVPEQHDCKKI